MRLAALYRNPSFSPGRHRDNDAAILDAVVARVEAAGHDVIRSSELEIEAGRLPEADGYLNMCQGPSASRRLADLAPDRTPVLNPASGVLNCHRARLVSLLTEAGLPFPETVILDADRERNRFPSELARDGAPVWVKRGDVHAQSADDVVSVPLAGLAPAVAGFGHRGIATVAVQAHVAGPVLKFYGVRGTPFFHAYPAAPIPSDQPRPDIASLARVAFRAAEVLGLEAFGGDAAFPSFDDPILIDVNDWPSYAPVREAAADAIAHRFLRLFAQE